MPTATELLDASLAAIADHGARTNAFILVDEEGARAAARQADDEKIRGIDRGPLHGVPVSVKDLIDIAGQRTTAASRVRSGHLATRDAPVVMRLREAGAVIIGKTNLHEFALGPTGDDSAFGPVRNPHDVTRMSGGSSSGSAAAVACGMGLMSVGSDTGGSIRIPAAACGVVGLKPSLGDVPTEGVVALSSTLDHVGPITRTVADAAALWSVLAGRPPLHLVLPDPRALRFGVVGDYFTELLDDTVRAAFENAIARFRAAGASIAAATIPGAEKIAETYANISLPEGAHWHGETLDRQAADYSPVVRDRFLFARTIPAVKYLEALDVRAELTAAVTRALDECDALLLPTLPVVAPPIGATEVVLGGATLPVRPLLLRLTQLFNLTGNPAISIPVPSDGLPVGLQIVGRRGDTAGLLAIAAACERLATGA